MDHNADAVTKSRNRQLPHFSEERYTRTAVDDSVIPEVKDIYPILKKVSSSIFLVLAESLTKSLQPGALQVFETGDFTPECAVVMLVRCWLCFFATLV